MKHAIQTIHYSTFTSPFGNVLVASTNKGIRNVLFFKNKKESVKDLEKRNPKANIVEKKMPIHTKVQKFFAGDNKKISFKLDIKSTDFQKKVWQALRKIPFGKTKTYSDISKSIGKPKSVRAVGTAIGSNPIAYIIPCHRVVTSSGALGGYRWGVERKKKMLKVEKDLV